MPDIRRAVVALILSLFTAMPVLAQSDPPPVYIEGRWVWEAACTSGKYKGEWVIHQNADGTFAGAYGNTNIADVGSIEDGVIEGRNIRFVHAYRHLLYGKTREQVRAKYRYVNGQEVVLDGTATGPGYHCTYEARRKKE